MKTLEQGQEKIKKICNALRLETLEPAMAGADRLIAEAQAKAEHIIEEGKKQCGKLLKDTHEAIERERNVFYSSLEQAGKQVIDSLKGAIEKKIFNQGLEKLVATEMGDPQIIARLIDTLVQAIQKEGLSKDFAALIPVSIAPEDVNKLLMRDILEQLKQGPLPIGDFGGGVQLKLVDKGITLDLSDNAICDLLKTYVRQDFRKYIFKASKIHG
jgi:V/A-type H+-transporting ATPase subunit E